MRSFIADSVYALLVVMSFSAVAQAQRRETDGSLPEMVDGWKKCDSSLHYDRENIFDYMNGGAEVYLAYDFESLTVQKYCRDTNEITVEIYRTKTSDDAFGLYSQNHLKENVGVAQRSSYDSGELSFWKSRCFVRVLSWEAKDRLKENILMLGKSIARGINEKGELPDIFCALPKHGMVRGSEHYFHTLLSLNGVYFISSQDILNLSPAANGVIVDYIIGADSLKYLLIQYSDDIESKKALQLYLGAIGPENLKTVNAFRVGRYLGIVVQCKKEESAFLLLRSSQQKLEQAFKKGRLAPVGWGIHID